MNAVLHGQLGDNYCSGEPVNVVAAGFMDDTVEAVYLYLTPAATLL